MPLLFKSFVNRNDFTVIFQHGGPTLDQKSNQRYAALQWSDHPSPLFSRDHHVETAPIFSFDFFLSLNGTTTLKELRFLLRLSLWPQGNDTDMSLVIGCSVCSFHFRGPGSWSLLPSQTPGSTAPSRGRRPSRCSSRRWERRSSEVRGRRAEAGFPKNSHWTSFCLRSLSLNLLSKNERC